MARGKKQDSEKLRLKYNSIVSEINKQIKKLEKVDGESVTLDRYRNYFKKVNTKNPNLKTMQKLLKSAENVLSSGVLSLKGNERAKANAIDTLHREGYTFINKRNFNSFMRFLDDARARGLGALYSSEQILTAINEGKRKGLTDAQIKSNIKRWSDDVKKTKDGKIVEVDNPKPLKNKKW